METRARHFLVGVFTLLGVGLALGLGLWTAKFTTEAAWQEYEIHFDQAVTGLSAGGAVQYNGIRVGSVRELSLDPEDPRTVIARVRLEADAPVREDTTAELALAGLTGVTMIQLRGGSPGSPPLRAGPGEALPRIPAERSALQQVLESSEDIAGAVSEVFVRLLNILSEENAARITSSLESIETFTRAMTVDEARLDATVANVHDVSAGMQRAVGEFEALLGELRATLGEVNTGLVDALPALNAELAASLQNLSALTARADRILAANETALASFGSEGLGQLGPTLRELRRVLREFRQLGQRFERSPARFIMGGDQPEEYRPR